jgi:hypothetical protein
MFLKFHLGLAAMAGVAFLMLAGGAEEKQPAKKAAASKLDLTPDSLPKLHALVRPRATEWRHLKVEWITDVAAARKRAATDDKPIVVLYAGGAGYNEPLGIC